MIARLIIAILLTAPGLAPGAVASRRLARELFDEGDWAHARIEVERLLRATPDDPALQLMRAQCLARQGRPDVAAFESIIARPDLDGDRRVARASRPCLDELRAEAHYELGLLKLPTDRDAAFTHFQQAFTSAADPALWSRSGYYLHQLGRTRGLRNRLTPALALQLRACRRTWDADLRREHRIAPRGRLRRATVAPAVAVIHFYQRQIAPAIGTRCSLEPSCSRYAVEALRTHGWRGLPMIADRSIREPDVVAARQSPVTIGDRQRFRDPLSDHDWWFRR